MTNEQIESLFGELSQLLREARIEVRALREMLLDHGVIDEEELGERIKDLTLAERVQERKDLERRVLDETGEGEPIQ